MNAHHNFIPPQECASIRAVKRHADLPTDLQPVLGDLALSLTHHVGRRISPAHAVLRLAAHLYRETDVGLLLAALVTAERAAADNQRADVAFSMIEDAADAMTFAVDEISADMGRLSAKLYVEASA